MVRVPAGTVEREVDPEPAPRAPVRAVVLARTEAGRIGPTVTALLTIPEVESVTVVDDGSLDRTASEASRAGAAVLRGPGRGKGGALEAALDRLEPARVYLLADGDLGASASELRAVLAPVLRGEADLAVGVPPAPPTGGFGLVRALAARLIGRIGNPRPRQPLSGQRAVTRTCLWACRPLASRFGLESAMTADALRLGYRLMEVPVAVEHRFTRKDWTGFAHRGRQGLDILRAMAPRMVGLR
jgi:glycosyltransferase involved in cell wall biosynthesis